MTPREFIASYWRVMMLLIFLVVAVYALFVPGGVFSQENVVATNNTTQSWTNPNLQYGLGLDGGTRISAPVVGMTAENLDISPDEAQRVENVLYRELDVDTADAMVRIDQETGQATAEVFTKNVTESEFANALQAAGLDVNEEDIRQGVTSETRNEITLTIETKINEAGLSGGRVSEQATLGGENLIVVEVPDRTAGELRSLLQERGIVEVVAHYPGPDGNQTNETVLTRDDLDEIGTATYNDQIGHHVPVTVADDVAPDYEQRLNELGFTTPPGLQNCDVKNPETGEINFDVGKPNYCLLTVVDGEVVDAHSMGTDLGTSMASNQWRHDPSFVMITPSQPEAASLSVALRAGSLRAPLDLAPGNYQAYTIQPALADQFKQFSLIIAILAVISVSGVVYLRYADQRVAIPMIVTALSEVVILLGFAAAIRMPLDLSHIAGFIAVVGTGVDDLIIIADEVMSQGDVDSRRVFQSRFRKAFWVIGAAAATTIVALSPLAVLSLGDLRGFAIITILGVLIGVLITRPAYGDILRYLLTDR